MVPGVPLRDVALLVDLAAVAVVTDGEEVRVVGGPAVLPFVDVVVLAAFGRDAAPHAAPVAQRQGGALEFGGGAAAASHAQVAGGCLEDVGQHFGVDCEFGDLVDGDRCAVGESSAGELVVESVVVGDDDQRRARGALRVRFEDELADGVGGALWGCARRRGIFVFEQAPFGGCDDGAQPGPGDRVELEVQHGHAVAVAGDDLAAARPALPLEHRCAVILVDLGYVAGDGATELVMALMGGPLGQERLVDRCVAGSAGDQLRVAHRNRARSEPFPSRIQLAELHRVADLAACPPARNRHRVGRSPSSSTITAATSDLAQRVSLHRRQPRLRTGDLAQPSPADPPRTAQRHPQHPQAPHPAQKRKDSRHQTPPWASPSRSNCRRLP